MKIPAYMRKKIQILEFQKLCYAMGFDQHDYSVLDKQTQCSGGKFLFYIEFAPALHPRVFDDAILAAKLTLDSYKVGYINTNGEDENTDAWTTEWTDIMKGVANEAHR